MPGDLQAEMEINALKLKHITKNLSKHKLEPLKLKILFFARREKLKDRLVSNLDVSLQLVQQPSNPSGLQRLILPWLLELTDTLSSRAAAQLSPLNTLSICLKLAVNSRKQSTCKPS